ncbi:hypothetical protein GCM10010523_03180 [Paenarthrobacter ilicis]|uniref:arsenate reductase/protein-tyrosine-phosphatase family protein n=1 Tax=Paenarthrobacter ilicis TaxID=43665 RepID=UPI001FB91103|nr:hypothetical protein [Paenarthrobacter ilicis]
MPLSHTGGKSPSSILTVCTGNICRSPLAEQVIRHRLQQSGVAGFTVASAGLHAAVNAPMEPLPAMLSRELGGDPTGSHGKQITLEAIESAELVLTMTLKQRDELVKKFPGAAQRTFTMAEFARAGQGLPLAQAAAVTAAPSWASVTGTATGSPVAELVRRTAAVRSTAGLTSADDIPDPINADEAVHRDVAQRINGYSQDIVAVLSHHL